jgi:hypothetical protein
MNTPLQQRRPRRDQRAFLADLEPMWAPAMIYGLNDREVEDLVSLGIEALMEA